MGLLRNDALRVNNRLRRYPTTEHEWSEWIKELNRQNVVVNTAETFTPTWGGFSVDPSGDLSYINLGQFAMIWNATGADMLGTSDDAILEVTGLPAAITPSDSVGGGITLTIDGTDGDTQVAWTQVVSSGVIRHFRINSSGTHADAPATAYAASGDKGLDTTWRIIYPLV